MILSPKKTAQRFAALLSMFFCLLAICSPAAAELNFTDANKVIKLHNQYEGYKPTGGLKGGATGYYGAEEFQIQNGKYWCWWGDVYGVDCLEQGGCHAFSYSHAVQWLLQQNLGDEVLHALIDVCENPSDYSLYHGYPKCKASPYPHTDSNGAYARLCEEQYGLATAADSAPDREREEWLRFFDDGKIAILLVDGHYNVAVDYVVYNGAAYVQILDSAPNASLTRTWEQAYTVVNNKAYPIGTPAFARSPFQYWVTMEDFLAHYITVDVVLYGGVWEGHADRAE